MGQDQVTGIAIGAESVEWTVIRRSKSGVGVLRSGRVEGGIPFHDTGQADPAGMASVENQLRAEPRWHGGTVTAGLSSDSVLLRLLQLPAVPRDELTGMVELQMDKLSPFPMEMMTVSYEVVRRVGDTCQVIVAAAKTEVIEHLGAHLDRAGILPDRVDATALGWWRCLFEAGEIHPQGRHLTLTLNPAAPEIIVFQDGVPIFFRTLGSVVGLSGADTAEEVVREIDYTLMSVELEHGSASSCTVTLWAAESEACALLIKRLSESTPYSIEHRNPGTLASASDGIARRSLDVEEPRIDLRPHSWLEAARVRRFWRTTWTAVGAAVGVWAVIVAAGVGALYYEGSKLAALQVRLDEVKGPATEVREMRRKVITIRRYEDRHDSALECLREISGTGNQPPGVELTSFTYVKGENVKISGMASEVNQVLDFKRRLDSATNVFQGSTMDGPRFDRSRQKELFDLDLKLPGGGT